ncbi:MAG: pyruvate kinase [Verrucomicrobia subdivision 3 bacterium]|nr:pyruvate kinase [Limisphaerales bacterium]
MQSTRQTRILATLGPVTQTEESIGALLDAGANMFRLNMSHAKQDWVRSVTGHIRAAAVTRGCVAGIVMDLQGPAIRTGDLPAPVCLETGDRFDFTVDAAAESERCVSVNYPDFLNDIEEGATILIDSGLIRMRVLRLTDHVAECEVEVGGELGNRRHINLPGTKVNLPALTEKDRADVAIGLELDVDYFALSFVRAAADVALLQERVAGHPRPPKVIAKVEDQHAVKHIDAIIAQADAIMVARGDLGVECPFEDLPILQREIVRACQAVGKPVIVATHMLESMINEPMPTRAEVTDVANAVFEQTDAIMLSGETSVGEFPNLCVEAMDRIARRMESEPAARFHELATLTNERQKLAKAAVHMADDLGAQAIIVFTRAGRLAPEVAWMRPRSAPILALCLDASVASPLALLRGVRPVVLPWDEVGSHEAVNHALQELVARSLLDTGDIVVVVSSSSAVEEIADSVQMCRVG